MIICLIIGFFLIVIPIVSIVVFAIWVHRAPDGEEIPGVGFVRKPKKE